MKKIMRLLIWRIWLERQLNKDEEQGHSLNKLSILENT